MNLKSLCIAAGMLGALFQAQAQTAPALVTVQEFPKEYPGSDPYYVVTNGSNTAIQFFAVTNPRLGNVAAMRSGWIGMSLPSSAWNNPDFMMYFNCSPDAIYFQCGTPHSVVSVLGTFEAAFGVATGNANLFWNRTSPGNLILPGETSERFYFNGPIASEYAAWNVQGKPIYLSYAPTAVPEPETLALFGLGLAALAVRRHRRPA